MNPQAQPVRSGSSLPAASVELRHLRYFLAVAQELNFTRAASRLNVAQQTLSEGIAQLEDTLGLRLFERTRPLQLTDSALRWLPSAKQALEAAERAKEAGVTKVVFDRGGFLYHGRVAAVADGAREAGLEF